MRTRSRGRERRKKLCAALVAASLLFNIILVTPAFASTGPTPLGANSCWPIWPFCTPSSPTPGAGTPTPIGTPTGTPTSTPTGTPSGTPTVTPTGTPTPTPVPPPIQLSAFSSYVLTATTIVAKNARLDQSNPFAPILIFDSMTVTGMRITHLSFTFHSTGLLTATGVAIKTSVLQNLITALNSFTDKADILLLTAGATIPTLTMTNVHLQVDYYIHLQTITIPGFVLP